MKLLNLLAIIFLAQTISTRDAVATHHKTDKHPSPSKLGKIAINKAKDHPTEALEAIKELGNLAKIKGLEGRQAVGALENIANRGSVAANIRKEAMNLASQGQQYQEAKSHKTHKK